MSSSSAGRPSIAVAVATRNRAALLAGLLDSIAAGSRLPEQLIIVDNGSSDQTAEVVAAFARRHPALQLCALREERVGRSIARNRCLDAATTDIVAFTDDDCLVDARWLSHLLAAHARHPEAVAIGGETLWLPGNLVSLAGHCHRRFVTWRDALQPEPVQWAPPEPCLMTSLATQNISYKREPLADCRFDEGLPTTEAVDLAWQILRRHPRGILLVPEAVVWHRYPEALTAMMRQHFEYGRDSQQLYAQAEARGYLPRQAARRSNSQRLRQLCLFTRHALHQHPLPRRPPLLLLLLAKELAGAAGYLYGGVKQAPAR